MTTGEKIKARRKELGLSQQELAERMGLTSKSSICKMEKDVNSNFTMDTVDKLAKALNVSSDYFISVSTDTELSAKIRKQMLMEDGFLNGDDIVLIDKYHCLNDAGIKKLDEYLDDLLENPKYKLEETEPFDYSVHKTQEEQRYLDLLRRLGSIPIPNSEPVFSHSWVSSTPPRPKKIELISRTQFNDKK